MKPTAKPVKKAKLGTKKLEKKVALKTLPLTKLI
jgi:hypothetical protein